MLSSRERVSLALNHQEADRVPIAFGGRQDSIHIAGYRALKNYLGLETDKDRLLSEAMQNVVPDPRLLERYKVDTLGVSAHPPDSFTVNYKKAGNYLTIEDEWGNTLRRPMEESPKGFFFDYCGFPLSEKDAEGIKKYVFSNPRDFSRFRGMREKLKTMYHETDKAIVAYSYTPGIFECCCSLRGFEQTFIDTVSNIKILEVLSEKLLNWMLDFWEAYLKEIGDLIQIVQIGDDLGGQNGPLFSPKVYRSVFKSKHREIISMIKKYTDAKIYFHSCGSVYDFIPDLIDIGVDILNPVQCSAKNMEGKKLKREFGNDLAFWGGGCDPFSTFCRGTPQDVKEEVKRQISALAPGGGYVFSSVHNIIADVPPENVEAFFQAAYEYGKY